MTQKGINRQTGEECDIKQMNTVGQQSNDSSVLETGTEIKNLSMWISLQN